MSTDQNLIILFDGVCNLCNSYVNLIIDRDNKNIFKFAAIQSEAGQNLLNQLNINSKDLYSIILIESNKYFVKSSAALRTARRLNGLWKLFYILIVIPPFIRNWIYDFIANNRYKWFGKKDSCRVPSQELKEKFFN